LALQFLLVSHSNFSTPALVDKEFVARGNSSSRDCQNAPCFSASSSVMAAILLYAGLDFKSAKGEIEKAKNEIHGNVVASQQEVDRVKNSSAAAEAVAANAQTQIRSVHELLTRAQAYGQAVNVGQWI
jgi:hypothetical protein